MREKHEERKKENAGERKKERRQKEGKCVRKKGKRKMREKWKKRERKKANAWEKKESHVENAWKQREEKCVFFLPFKRGFERKKIREKEGQKTKMCEKRQKEGKFVIKK